MSTKLLNIPISRFVPHFEGFHLILDSLTLLSMTLSRSMGDRRTRPCFGAPVLWQFMIDFVRFLFEYCIQCHGREVWLPYTVSVYLSDAVGIIVPKTCSQSPFIQFLLLLLHVSFLSCSCLGCSCDCLPDAPPSIPPVSFSHLLLLSSPISCPPYCCSH